MILGQRGLGVLHCGILEGRRASGNMMKYLLMGTSSNFGNMFSMAAASAFLPFLPMLPTQILLNNFLLHYFHSGGCFTPAGSSSLWQPRLSCYSSFGQWATRCRAVPAQRSP